MFDYEVTAYGCSGQEELRGIKRSEIDIALHGDRHPIRAPLTVQYFPGNPERLFKDDEKWCRKQDSNL